MTKKTLEKKGLTDLQNFLTANHSNPSIDKVFNEGILKVSEGEDCTHSVIMFDIDFFKSINDLYSHLHGDDVLKRIGHLLKNYKQGSEVFCLIGRWGGEEFLMVVPYDSKKIAKYVADEIRERVCSHDFSDIGKDIGKELKEKITMSMGVHYVDLVALVESFTNAKKSTDDKSEDEIVEKEIDKTIQRADTALDYAKFMGRNRVEILCEEVERTMNELDILRRLYSEYAHKKPEEIKALLDGDYLTNNLQVRNRIKKHFIIIRSEIQQKDTRTQAVFADNLYRQILSTKDERKRADFMDFVKKYSS